MMAKKLIFGLLLLIMVASISACASPGTKPDDASLNKDNQTQYIIGGYTKILVGGEVK
ncbi:MAG: hypothetical protein ACLQUW_16445 [Desulfobaccales bacterium]